MIDHKLAELAEQQHRIEVARNRTRARSAMPASEPMNAPDSGRSSKATARPLTRRKPRANPLTDPSPMRTRTYAELRLDGPHR